MKAAKDVQVGDLVDLEGDRYADPDSDNVALQYLYLEVGAVEQETPECVLISFESFDAVGFPTNHELRVQGA